MKLYRDHDAVGRINAVVSTAAALAICAAIVPGTTMSWGGFLIAFAIIAWPDHLVAVYTKRGMENYRADGRVAGGCAGIFAIAVWMFAGPLVADWATPDFNIGGWWQYIVLLAVGLAVSMFIAVSVYRTYYVERWRDRHGSSDISS